MNDGRLLEGKTAIITGTNRGIGRAIAEAFAENGANIYAHARCETDGFVSDMKGLEEKFGVEIWPVYFDLTDTEAMKSAVKQIMSEKRGIDALVNSAGITLNTLFHMTSESMLREQFEVNFFSLFFFTQMISKLMIRRKTGSIINIASTAGEDGNPGRTAYGGAKAAVIAMTKSVAAELGEYGIRANSIAPGITETDMLPTMSDEVIEQTSMLFTDLRRIGQPFEIANAAVFLASDMSSYITGQSLRVDGGLTS